jgi:hypothetical protein
MCPMYKRIESFECVCDICGHRWISEAKPVRCAKCKTRVWNCDGVTVEPKKEKAPMKAKPAVAIVEKPQTVTEAVCKHCGGSLAYISGALRCVKCWKPAPLKS